MYFYSALVPFFALLLHSVKAEELGQLTMAKNVILSLKTLCQFIF